MSLYVYESGPKGAPAIVFLHGAGMSGWMWKKQIEYFSDYHCIVPDLPEHGKSIDEKPITLYDCANRVIEIIEQRAEGGKAHIVGHSLGAKVVIELLGINSSVVDHTVSASALFNPTPVLDIFYNSFANKLTELCVKSNGLMKMQARQFKFPDEYYSDNFIRDSQALKAGTLDRIMGEMYKHMKLPENLNKVNVPTLILCGEKELKAMRKSVSGLANLLPNSKGMFLKGAMHNYPWAMYDTFNSIIRAWINDMPLQGENIINL